MDPKIKLKDQRGFSLIEMMISMGLFLIVLSGVYVMVVHYGQSSQTEHSRLRMQQETRYLTGPFASDIQNAGAVLTITFTGFFLKDDPYFNGIWPLNKVNYPDGIIVASGDPEAVTRLTESYIPGDSGPVLAVETTELEGYDATRPYELRQWAKGDTGIIVCKEGYFVFCVERLTDTTIIMREEPVYFSGLLNTIASTFEGISYADTVEVPGDSVEYPVNAPVIRLDSFAVYLFKEVAHPFDSISDRLVRQFIRISDCMGEADVLGDGSKAVKSIISENIWDMQISYLGYEHFDELTPETPIDKAHYYFAGGTTNSSADDLVDDLRARRLKQVDISVIIMTDEYGGIGKFEDRFVPALGDRIGYNLPDGKYSYKIVDFSIETKNYNIIFSD
jgi:prepilin-type N-terminal cleavage/methylation domain-containing protein